MLIAVDRVPSLGMLMGNVSDKSVIDSINNAFHPNGISMSESFARHRDIFVNKIVEPFRRTFETIKEFVTLDDVNLIKPIITMDELYTVPPAMYLPILMYEPVRTLFEAGRIDGYGIEYLPEEDYYSRLINNGVVDLNTMDDQGEVEFVYTYSSNDPDIEFDELDAIEQTREYLDKFLEQTVLDPTNPSKRRG